MTAPDVNQDLLDLSPSHPIAEGQEQKGLHLELQQPNDQVVSSTRTWTDIASQQNDPLVSSNRGNSWTSIASRNYVQPPFTRSDHLTQPAFGNVQTLSNLNAPNLNGRNRRCELYDISSYEGRLDTFFDWKVPFLDKEVLAEAGFWYTGTNDRVVCAECEGELYEWQLGDDPRQQHHQLFKFICFE
ncbi:E3 ubiquitin-protein ligase XIAP-like [Mercenaria mercenaria]|uniref:E3 ubiquitin-protein ligase XIAP-like n=1 Tax=Mercenaria mercenaria TaxID=6596 RepID=UPI001E1DD04F|nr:E3 ubiquitin-protein ligase XIAP-like [Mercenaria mercenaria]XP_045205358.1 E3 ubiquitin-protein ligase XIAP-like [Mercenaria mercenaria]